MFHHNIIMRILFIYASFPYILSVDNVLRRTCAFSFRCNSDNLSFFGE